jgi:hypothetical protein
VLIQRADVQDFFRLHRPNLRSMNGYDVYRLAVPRDKFNFIVRTVFRQIDDRSNISGSELCAVQILSEYDEAVFL